MLNEIGAKTVDFTKLKQEQQKFVYDHLYVDVDKITEIEESTLGQSLSDRWYDEIKKRITSSHFGSVINRRPTVYPKSLLQKLMQTKRFNSNACTWGKENEKYAIQKYQEITGNSVTECGFIVNPQFPWLGASPDGVIPVNDGSRKIVEVKCTFSKRDMSIKDACADKSFLFEIEW